MKNQEIADIFEQMANLMEILGENPFRVNSYHKAARVVEELTDPIEDRATAGTLQDIDGIGQSTAEKIQEYLDSGKMSAFENLKKKIPPGLPELLDVPGLGPKTVAKLWHEGKITSLDELKAALANRHDALTKIEGLGEKKLAQLADSLNFMAAAGERIRLGKATALAAALVEEIADVKGVARVMPAGSLRRSKETIGDIDLLCQAAESRGEAIIEAFTSADNVQRVLASGKTKGSVVLESGVQADLRAVPKKSFGAALNYFTGSKAHNVALREIAVKKKLKLNEYGLFRGDKQIAGQTEEDLYEALGLAYVAPELREDTGEIQAAADDDLPELLTGEDIHGDLHMHTTASDGHNTIDEMIAACKKRGYKFMCISDHSQSQVQANGLDAKRLKKHTAAIRKAGEKHKGILVLAGIEVDIFKDGSLDFPDDVLASLDFVIASPHSALSQKRPEATKRLIKAIEHPHVHCIGHPTGRLINIRPGMEIDIDEIASAAAEHDVALEINASDYRLDLRDTHVRAAIAKGAKLLINTDAHNTEQLDLMRFGVATARRGWATADDVVNTWTAAKLKKWLASKK